MAQRRSLLAAVAGFALLTAPALAQEPTGGGAAAPEPTEISSYGCSALWTCKAGGRMVMRGAGLDGVEAVVFTGGRGGSDDRTARPAEAEPGRLTLTVPRDARSGPLRVQTYDGSIRAPEALTIDGTVTSHKALAVSRDGVFPIQGPHDMGSSATNGFGGGRGHQGQDMFARCGTPLVAVRDATVQFAASQDRAGNYVVLQDATGQSYTYMHMRDRALVRKGDTVVAGERIGYVGETGRASGCHLHFELWTAPGWYTGGQAVDPLPQLQEWESAHKHRR